MLKTFRPLTCIAAICAASFLSAQEAPQAKIVEAGFIEDVGASERINFSGKLRMLSQRIPGAACYSHAKIDAEKSNNVLVAATAEFDMILNALEFGEESLNINGVEEDRKVLAGIRKMHSIWDVKHEIINHIVDNGGSDEEVQNLAEVSHDMLAVAKKLVTVLVAEYADPTALLQADAITLDIAGRQRMLAQRISKNVCLIASGYDVERATKEIEGARKLYDASVNALRFGMPEAGIIASTNPEILSRLDDVIALWADVQPVIETAKAGEDISDEQLSFIFNAGNSLTGQMNTLVGMYNDDSKMGL